MKYFDIDRIYREIPLDKIPWNSEIPPEALVELVQEGKVRPCRTIDLGCGAGNYALYLAGRGFDVTGVDSSPTAIKIAEENAKIRGVRCRFIVADLLCDLHQVTGTFDFAYDWEFLHHIFPEDRKTYIKNVYTLLNPGATYFSVCFSEKDPQFGGQGKYRQTRIGTTLYFSSESEVRELLSLAFTIRELKTVEISGKYGPHCAVSVLAVRN
ncbi:MAG: class I SAM-dependent methyltransferase [Bacteroidales bacterium]|nr:class I SAM-dependent methyltransferase [Bacteroidales bacterium]